VIQAYVDGLLDRVEMIYNSYVSPLTQHVTHQTLLPLSHQAISGEDGPGGETTREDNYSAPGASGRETGEASRAKVGPKTSVDYEPDPEKILRRLVPDYIEISIYRALVESAAGFFGAQMTAMRSASENAGEIITDYTLQMNRARQAEITQEIMEVVAGAEGLS
jgi:F-type H+-transporting ATPase subunit gamma